MMLWANDADSIFSDSDFGTSGRYTIAATGATSTKTAVIDRGVLVMGDADQVYRRQTTLSFLKSEISLPVPGDTFYDGTTTWTLQQIESDDGIVVKMFGRG